MGGERENGIEATTPIGSIRATGRDVVWMVVVMAVGFLVSYSTHLDHQGMREILNAQLEQRREEIRQREEEIKQKKIGNWLQSLPEKERPRLPMPPEARMYLHGQWP